MRPLFLPQEFGSVPFQNVVFSLILFFIMYPFGAGKSLSSSNSANTTVSGNTSQFSAQERLFLRKIKDIINQKARANVLKECNTTKAKVLAEIMKRYRRTSKNTPSGGRPSKIRMKDFVRERKIVGKFISATNQRMRQVSFKNGNFLSMDSSGNMYGTTVTSRDRNNTIFHIKLSSARIIRLQSFQTKKYVAMDRQGHVYAKATPDHDTLFYLRREENHFLTLASYKYYLLCPQDMFLAIRITGQIKSPHQSVPGQDSTQFILVPVK